MFCKKAYLFLSSIGNTEIYAGSNLYPSKMQSKSSENSCEVNSFLWVSNNLGASLLKVLMFWKYRFCDAIFSSRYFKIDFDWFDHTLQNQIRLKIGLEKSIIEKSISALVVNFWQIWLNFSTLFLVSNLIFVFQYSLFQRLTFSPIFQFFLRWFKLID